MNLRLPFFYTSLRPLVRVFLYIKFGYRCKVAEDLAGPYIVLSNHTTDFDPLFVGASFPKQMYFVASEHIARWKHAFRFIRFAFDPIIRYKGSVAASTVVDVLKKVRAGHNVCIFAEGARSWDGLTGPILPSTGKLVKSARCALVTYKIVGGYFASPNWSQKGTRKGYVRGSVVRVYSKEELEKMSVDQVNAAINADLFEDAYARQLKEPKVYKGKNPAYRMENMLFICPFCGKTDCMVSEKDTVSCSQCGKSFRYDDYGMLPDAPHPTVRELYAWQLEQVRRDAAEDKTYSAENVALLRIDNHTETPLCTGLLSLGPDGIAIGDHRFALSDIIDLAMHGRQAIVFSCGRQYYELIPSEPVNMLKFHLLYLAHRELANNTGK